MLAYQAPRNVAQVVPCVTQGPTVVKEAAFVLDILRKHDLRDIRSIHQEFKVAVVL